MFKRIFFAFLSFLGWILSPLTWWNDAFVNLPIAYIIVWLINKVFGADFLGVFLVAYWFTNLLGIFLMYVGAKGLTSKELIKNKGLSILVTILIYSIISTFLIRFRIIRPF